MRETEALKKEVTARKPYQVFSEMRNRRISRISIPTYKQLATKARIRQREEAAAVAAANFRELPTHHLPTDALVRPACRRNRRIPTCFCCDWCCHR